MPVLIFFYPEEESSTFFRIASTYQPNYRESQPVRRQASL